MLTDGVVTLREVRTSDLHALHRVFAELDSWGARSTRPPTPLTYEGFVEWYRPIVDGGAVELVVEAAGAVCGRCTIHSEDPHSRVGEVGIALLPQARGRGYGPAALRLLVDFAFRHRNLRRLVLESLATNAVGLAAYRAVGFVDEGVAREHAWADGAYVDVVRMGLLRRDRPEPEPVVDPTG